MNMTTMHIIIAGSAFIAGHVAQAKFNTLGRIGNVLGMIPVVGDTIENVWEKLE